MTQFIPDSPRKPARAFGQTGGRDFAQWRPRRNSNRLRLRLGVLFRQQSSGGMVQRIRKLGPKAQLHSFCAAICQTFAFCQGRQQPIPLA